MILYLGAIDPRIWRLVVAAELTARCQARGSPWSPDAGLVELFTRMVTDLVGPGRVRMPADDHPAAALLYDPDAHAIVLERVLAGLSFGCARRPPKTRTFAPEYGHDSTAA